MEEKKMKKLVLTAAAMFAAMTLAGSAYAADEIVIGAVYPMTGDLADSGKTMQEGIDMAVEEINEAGGIEGKTVKVIYGDSKGDEWKAAEVARIKNEQGIVELSEPKTLDDLTLV